MPQAMFEAKTEGAYLCGKCGNWYTRVPNPDPEDFCNMPHSATACCHYNEKASLPPEITTAKAMKLAQDARDVMRTGAVGQGKAKLAEAIGAAAGLVELITPRQAVDHKTGQMHTYINAEAFALPGRDDGVWYDLTGLREAVQMGRRPPTDAVTMERCVRVTRGQAEAAIALIEEAKALLAFVPTVAFPPAAVAGTPVEAQPEPVSKYGRTPEQRAKRNAALAKQRAAAKARRAATKEAVPA